MSKEALRAARANPSTENLAALHTEALALTGVRALVLARELERLGGPVVSVVQTPEVVAWLASDALPHVEPAAPAKPVPSARDAWRADREARLAAERAAADTARRDLAAQAMLARLLEEVETEPADGRTWLALDVAERLHMAGSETQAMQAFELAAAWATVEQEAAVTEAAGVAIEDLALAAGARADVFELAGEARWARALRREEP